MATELVTGLPEESVRSSLLCLSARLEAEWRAAAERFVKSPPQSLERQRWETALRRLTDALNSLEGFAGSLDTSLGRRDWTARRPKLYGVPSQPMAATFRKR